MIDVIFALAVGTLPPAAPAPAKVDADCVKTEPVVHKRRKPGIVRRRLFKSDPKPIVEPCEEAEPRLPPTVDLPPLEPEAPYSPAPIEPIELFPPLYVVPVPEEPPETFAGPSPRPPPWFYTPPAYVPPAIFVPLPATPEPSTWALLVAGLFLIRRVRGSRP